MTTSKIPVRTVYDNSNIPIGLAEFQVGEVISINHGGTNANTVANAKINLSLDNSNVRALFTVAGSGSYDNTTGIITVTGGVTTVGGVSGTISNAQLASSVTTGGLLANTNLTGTPVAPTASLGSNTTQIATTSFVTLAVANLIDSAPGALDTLNELAAAINDDSSFFTTIADQLNNKANTASLTTANVSEVTNLYFTNARSILSAIPAVTQLAVSASGSSAYLIDSYDGNNPTIFVTAGETISFDLNVSGHPFMIRVSAGGSNYSTGLTHIATDGTQTTGSNALSKVAGKLFWKVPYSLAGNTYVYQCSVHAGMVGSIVIQKPVGAITTSDVSEGSNLYFSNARVRSAISAGDGTIIYDVSTGTIKANANVTATIENTVNNLTTANVTEAVSNLYFTNNRVVAALTGGENISIAANGRITAEISDTVTTIPFTNTNLNFYTTRNILSLSKNTFRSGEYNFNIDDGTNYSKRKNDVIHNGTTIAYSNSSLNIGDVATELYYYIQNNSLILEAINGNFYVDDYYDLSEQYQSNATINVKGHVFLIEA